MVFMCQTWKTCFVQAVWRDSGFAGDWAESQGSGHSRPALNGNTGMGPCPSLSAWFHRQSYCFRVTVRSSGPNAAPSGDFPWSAGCSVLGGTQSHSMTHTLPIGLCLHSHTPSENCLASPSLLKCLPEHGCRHRNPDRHADEKLLKWSSSFSQCHHL